MNNRRFSSLLLMQAAVIVLLSLCGCDDGDFWWHDDDDDYPDSLVTANFTVYVYDYDTSLPVPGAEVRFYGDHGYAYQLDLYDDYLLVYTDADGMATTSVSAILNHPDECIGMRAVASYGSWAPGTSGTIRFWYPLGGSYTAVIFLDNPGFSGVNRYVPSSDYATIQDAVDAAADGDHIIVDVGRYAETIDFRGKDVVIESVAGPEWTILDGGTEGPAVTAVRGETRNAVLSGFTVVGGKPGLLVQGARPSFENNVWLTDMEMDDLELAAALGRGGDLRPEPLPVVRQLPAAAAIDLGRAPAKLAAATAADSWNWGWLVVVVVALLAIANWRYCRRSEAAAATQYWR